MSGNVDFSPKGIEQDKEGQVLMLKATVYKKP